MTAMKKALLMSSFGRTWLASEGIFLLIPQWISLIGNIKHQQKLDDGWPESEKDVFQAALRMVVVKDSR